MPNTDETESMDDIQELLMKKKSLEWNITLAKAKNAAYDKKIRESELELSHEKSQSELVKMLVDQSLRMLEVLQFNCLTFHSTMAQNEMCISFLMSFCEGNERYIDTDSKETELLDTKFWSVCQNAPWQIEKDQLTAEYDDKCAELGWLHHQNKRMDLMIAEKKRQIESHAKFTFKQFCCRIASFRNSAATLKSLLAKERRLNKEYNDRLFQNASLTDVLNLSQMSDYVQRHATPCFANNNAYYDAAVIPYNNNTEPSTSTPLNSSPTNIFSSWRSSSGDMLSKEPSGMDLSEYFPTQ